MPGVPCDLEVGDVTRTSVVLTWRKPTFDGGDHISGYKIEKKGKSSSRWIRYVLNFSDMTTIL